MGVRDRRVFRAIDFYVSRSVLSVHSIRKISFHHFTGWAMHASLLDLRGLSDLSRFRERRLHGREYSLVRRGKGPYRNRYNAKY